MKAFSFLAVAALMLATAAQATSLRPLELPIMRGNLTPVQGTGFTLPRPMTLTQNQSVYADEPTSFTLVEDTGIRCIMAPCPSQKTTKFKITDIVPALHNSDVVRYEAIEVLKNIPPNVRIAPRRLSVTESSMELVAPGGNGFMRRIYWDVEIYRFNSDPQQYSSNPKAIRR